MESIDLKEEFGLFVNRNSFMSKDIFLKEIRSGNKKENMV